MLSVRAIESDHHEPTRMEKRPKTPRWTRKKLHVLAMKHAPACAYLCLSSSHTSEIVYPIINCSASVAVFSHPPRPFSVITSTVRRPDFRPPLFSPARYGSYPLIAFPPLHAFPNTTSLASLPCFCCASGRCRHWFLLPH